MHSLNNYCCCWKDEYLSDIFLTIWVYIFDEMYCMKKKEAFQNELYSVSFSVIVYVFVRVCGKYEGQ